MVPCAQVLESLSGPPPKAFPLQSQYVKEIKKARAAAEPEDRQNSEAKRKVPKARKAKSAPSKPVGNRKASAWNYNEVRLSFLNDLKKKGFNFSNSTSAWDKSDQKREFLAPIPLQELKRRRFVDKTCTVNPWA